MIDNISPIKGEAQIKTGLSEEGVSKTGGATTSTEVSSLESIIANSKAYNVNQMARAFTAILTLMETLQKTSIVLSDSAQIIGKEQEKLTKEIEEKTKKYVKVGDVKEYETKEEKYWAEKPGYYKLSGERGPNGELLYELGPDGKPKLYPGEKFLDTRKVQIPITVKDTEEAKTINDKLDREIGVLRDNRSIRGDDLKKTNTEIGQSTDNISGQSKLATDLFDLIKSVAQSLYSR
jgi:hypothetical protein